jgi:hypothetical protein
LVAVEDFDVRERVSRAKIDSDPTVKRTGPREIRPEPNIPLLGGDIHRTRLLVEKISRDIVSADIAEAFVVRVEKSGRPTDCSRRSQQNNVPTDRANGSQTQ